jgi:tripartite-type tricarboxylate transporter receptor subunit TctC
MQLTGHITPDSLMSLEAYTKYRKANKPAIIAHRKLRSVTLGEHINLQFESETTIRYQIQEMLRIEKVFEEEGILQEIEAYAPLVPLAFQPHLVRNTGLGPDAVAPVCNVTENILGVMVKADSPWKTLPDMVAAAKQRPLSYGSPGPNSAPFLGVHRVQVAAGGQWTHVPFRGDGASLTEVIAGRLDFAAIVVASGVPMARAGQTRLVAVFSEGRHPAFPDVPTAREQGIDAFQPSYAALWATRGTPEPILDRLQDACRRAMETDGFKRFSENWGAVPQFRSRADLGRLLAAEYEATGKAFRELGVQPE